MRLVMVIGMLFRKETKNEIPRPARIKNMDDHQLRAWLNSCLMELGASYDNWAYHQADPAEFNKILVLVKDLWDEIQSRSVHI
jgi:hypothetical protein